MKSQGIHVIFNVRFMDPLIPEVFARNHVDGFRSIKELPTTSCHYICLWYKTIIQTAEVIICVDRDVVSFCVRSKPVSSKFLSQCLCCLCGLVDTSMDTVPMALTVAGETVEPPPTLAAPVWIVCFLSRQWWQNVLMKALLKSRWAAM